MKFENIEKLLNDEKIKNFIKESSFTNDDKNFFNIFSALKHHENPISDYLKYCFSNEKYNNIFLKSLEEIIYDNDINFENDLIKVEREYRTEEGYRIDLLIKTEKYVIGIENKIYADDKEQPYKEYAKEIKKLCDNKKMGIMILLSIYQNSSKNTEWGSDKKIKWKIIQYKDFIKNIEKNFKSLDFFSMENDFTISKDFLILKDFINKIKEIMSDDSSFEEDNKNENMLKIIKNLNLINKMYSKSIDYIDYVRNDFKTKIEKEENINEKKSWKYNPKLEEDETYYETNICLYEFDKYCNEKNNKNEHGFVIFLWISNENYIVGLGIPKNIFSETEYENFKPIKNIYSDNYKDWWLSPKDKNGKLFIKEYSYDLKKNKNIIDIDKCLEDAKEMIKDFKELDKQNYYSND